MIDSPANPIARWLPPLAGLAAAALASLLCPQPRPASLFPSTLIPLAALYGLLPYLVCAATMGLISRLVDLQPRSSLLLTSAGAVWFIPLVLLLHQQSPAAIAVGAMSGAAVTLALRAHQEGFAAAKVQNQTPERWMQPAAAFGLLPSHPPFHECFPALAASLCGEAAALCGLSAHLPAAVVLSGACSATLVWHLSAKGPQEELPFKARASRPNPYPLLALALVIIVVILLPYLRTGRRYHGLGGLSQGNSAGKPGAPKDSSAGRERFEASTSLLGDSYTGIILWPKIQPSKRLLAPLPQVASNAFPLGRSDPLSIPFNGVYWFFKFPDVRPPVKSRVARGDPAEFDIRSADQRPLEMEARQNLGTLIDINCCSAVEVQINNADRFPGTVFLDLILRDTTRPGKPSQALGTAIVSSTRTGNLDHQALPVDETLVYRIPPHPAIRRFDEVTVAFRLAPTRAEVGAKVAISRFVLLPR